MIVKSFKDEDFVNYKKPSMFIITPTCSFKCDKENGCNLCQNSHLAHVPTINIDTDKLIQRYIDNPITKAIVFGGLEPLDTFNELLDFVHRARYHYNITDDIVIYTGYTEEEVISHPIWNVLLMQYDNIVVKFGRFRPNQDPHYDNVLGVKLASNNQYAKKYNYEVAQ